MKIINKPQINLRVLALMIGIFVAVNLHSEILFSDDFENGLSIGAEDSKWGYTLDFPQNPSAVPLVDDPPEPGARQGLIRGRRDVSPHYATGKQ